MSEEAGAIPPLRVGANTIVIRLRTPSPSPSPFTTTTGRRSVCSNRPRLDALARAGTARGHSVDDSPPDRARSFEFRSSTPLARALHYRTSRTNGRVPARRSSGSLVPSQSHHPIPSRTRPSRFPTRGAWLFRVIDTSSSSWSSCRRPRQHHVDDLVAPPITSTTSPPTKPRRGLPQSSSSSESSGGNTRPACA